MKPPVSSPRAGVGATIKVKRPGERRSLSRTATRALDVLEQFGTRCRPLRAIEIARALMLTPSTTDQLLKTMVGSGHLLFDARHKTYMPSPRLVPFGAMITDLFGPDAGLRDLMAGLRQELGLVVTFSVPNDTFMQIVDAAIPEGQSAERGLRISVFGSAIGTACLSAMDDGEIERLAHRARLKDHELSGAREAIAVAREQGFSQGASVDGAIWSVAVPLRVPGMTGPAVLGTAGQVDRVLPQVPRLAEAMQRAAASYARSAASEGPEES